MLRTQLKATSNWVRAQVGIYRWRTALCVLVIALSSLPQLVGFMLTPDGGRYLGRTTLAPGDTMVYYGAIQEAANGHLFTSNPFTQEPQRARLLQPVWLVQGWIVRVTHLPVEVVYHLGRIISVVIFFVALWKITALITPNYTSRLRIQFLLTLSSGFGWVDYLFLRRGASYDLWVSEFNPFLTMMHSSLFMISQLLMIWLMYRWWTMMRDGQVRWWWGGGVALLGLIHPYDLVTVGLTCFLLIIPPLIVGKFGRRQVVNIVLALLWVAPVALYYRWVLQEPVLIEWAKQNIDRIGPYWRVALGLGAWGPLAVYGVIVAWQKKLSWVMPLAIWILSVMILITLPGLTFPRRLVNGITIPFILLSVVGCMQLAQSWSLNRRRYSWLAAATVVSFTTIVILVHQSLGFVDQKRASYPSYLTADDQVALAEVNKRVPSTVAVWASPWTANAFAGLYVHTIVVGHGHQTAHAAQKFQWWDDVRNAETSDADRATIITKTSPWLLWHIRDQRGTYQPSEDPHWEAIWTGQESTLYYYHQTLSAGR